MTAGKIVPKSLLTKSHQKEKMSQEIRFADKNRWKGKWFCLPGFIRGCRTRTWWSSSATSRTPTSCTSYWSFAGIVFASYWWSRRPTLTKNMRKIKTCISTVCSQKEKSDGVAQEAKSCHRTWIEIFCSPGSSSLSYHPVRFKELVHWFHLIR